MGVLAKVLLGMVAVDSGGHGQVGNVAALGGLAVAVGSDGVAQDT